MRAFIDTSSLFKKYIEENGSKKLEELLDIESKRFEYYPILLADIIYSDDENKLEE